MPNLDTDLLRTFIAVAEAQSFTRAAEAVFRTQAAISLQIKKLEDILGRRVFERDTRRVHLTPEGEILLVYARRMLALNDEALANVGRPEIDGVVRVGAPDDYAAFLLPRVLGPFARDNPRVRVEVACANSAELAPEVAQGRCDLALVARHVGEPHGTMVRRERLLWVAAPESGVSGGAAAEDPVPLALSPKGCVCRETAIAALERAGRRWRLAFSSPSVMAVHAAVAAGVAVTVVEESTRPEGLRIVGEKEGFPDLAPVEIALLTAPGATGEPVRRLARAIHERLGRAERHDAVEAASPGGVVELDGTPRLQSKETSTIS